MTAKQFFKSNAFKSIIALLCVLLVSGIFLTIAYGFLEVSKGEQLQRALSKIYSGKEIVIYGENDKEITAEDKNPVGLTKESVAIGNAVIDQAYKIVYTENEKEITNYLISSKGSGGFGGGVTCWVALISEDNALTGIESVSISSWGGETLSAEVSGSTLISDIISSYTDGIYYAPNKDANEYVVSGATRSSTAICNAVNGAIDYVKSNILGLSLTDYYKDYAYTDYISTRQMQKPAVSGNSVTYNIVTEGLRPAGEFKITVTVTDGKITAYNITQNGSTDETWAGKMDPTVKDGTYFTANGGKTAADLKAVLGENGDNVSLDGFESGATLTDRSHATKSNFLCLYAGLFATANYQTALGGNA